MPRPYGRRPWRVELLSPDSTPENPIVLRILRTYQTEEVAESFRRVHGDLDHTRVVKHVEFDAEQ